jgi:predicted ATP-dependent Lon-type protease
MDLDSLLNTHFAGRVVRKDLTKLVKEGANVPVYVLEYLLGQHCASNDEAISVGDIPSIPGELFAKFQTSFYPDPRDAAFKALGVE